MKQFYFSKFESRRPYTCLTPGKAQMFVFRSVVIATIVSGGFYFSWRWTDSLNPEAPIFSITLAVAETLSFCGVCLLFFDLWEHKDEPRQSAPHFLSEITTVEPGADRPVSIDVFIATINEEAELLRYTIRDAKAMEYPYPDCPVNIYLLDDGRRDGRDFAKENIKQLCSEEGVNYLTRENNIGFKAGNLKNGLENSSGDIFVILDADSRPFKHFLTNTLGYFKKKDVAWVQTCHWFYDTTPAVPLHRVVSKFFGVRSEFLKALIRKTCWKMKTGEDIYGSDPRQFYEVILRRRNAHNASFCCGACSVHRREAVMSCAQEALEEELDVLYNKEIAEREVASEEERALLKQQLRSGLSLTPFKYHISEDLYTSMAIHGSPKKWRSVLHPHAECKLLSPQDITSYVKQRTRYAEGSIDIFLHDNPVFRKGLTWRQKICYFHSVFSYFSCIWLVIFLLSPIIYFFTHALPVKCDSYDFYLYFVPYFIFNKLADTTGSWGINQKRGRQYYICLFWINLVAIIHVLSGRKVNFNVTPKCKQKTTPFKYAWPHMLLITLTVAGISKESYEVYSGHYEFSIAYGLNMFWGLYNCYMLNVFVRAAYWDAEALADPKEEGVADELQTETARMKN